MLDTGAPTADEQQQGFDDADDFEFIELVNVADVPIDLSEVMFQRVTVDGDLEGIDFEFSQSSIRRLGPDEHLLVVEDVEAFTYRYGDDLPVAGHGLAACR